MPVGIFCCYARKDQPLLKELKSHLMPLQREGLIILWADTDIDAGMEWEEEINKHLNTAQIILLLVSSDFIASEYCYGKEMTRAMERHKAGEAQVVPIILRPVLWENTPFGKLQALPTGARPVIGSTWHNQDMAFYNITEGIQKVVKRIQPPPPLPKPKPPEPPPVDPKVVVQAEKEQPDPQAFGELKRVYSWLSDDHLAFLQAFYPTWRRLAEADRGNLHTMLSGIPLPPETPGITWDQLDVILAFARATVRSQEEETT